MVLLDKLPWCSHDGNPLYTIHHQPKGTRFATGGSDSKVKIWNVLPALDARQENNNVPKLLATLTDHNGPVNIVRFSNNGNLLASGSDDHMACIYELRPGAGGNVLGSDTANIENWRTRAVLRGHASNVVDMAWAPDDSRLVTVGLETRVMIWDTVTGHCIKALDAHSSFVKGVAWDPIGSYVATYSEDRSVIIWRADDWSIVAVIKNMFDQMVTSTFACRLSWAPDGRHLVVGNSYQGTTHSAVVIPREGWNKFSDFMLINGHQGAVVAPTFSPKMLHLAKPGGGFDDTLSTIFALGSQDRHVTVWSASKPRALFGGKMFKAQVTDVTWTPDARSLLACSGDGTVACFQFAETELGKCATAEEMEEVLTKLYGSVERRTTKRTLAESAEQLHFEDTLQKQTPVKSTGLPRPAALAPAAGGQPSAMAALSARMGSGSGAMTQVGFGGAAAAGNRSIPVPQQQQQLSPGSRGAKKPRVALATTTGQVGGGQLIMLPPPPPRGELHTTLGRNTPLLNEQEEVYELFATNKTRGNVAECLIDGKKSGVPIWKDTTTGIATAIAGNLHFSAVGMSDGNLIIYSPAGRRLSPPLKLGAGIAVLACSKATASWELLAVTTSGSMRLFDVKNLKCILETTMTPLLEGGESVLDIVLSKSGAPIVTLSTSRAYVWHKDLASWMCVADEALSASHYTPLPGLGAGELGKVQSQVMGGATGLQVARIGGVSRTAQRHASRAHLEGNLGAAIALGSAEEYRRSLVTYAGLLADDGDEGRLNELCNELIGGRYLGSESWEPEVLGMNKREILKNEVLREVARNRDLGSLLQRVSTVLADLEEMTE